MSNKYKLVYEAEGWVKGSEEARPTPEATDLIEKAALEGTKDGEKPYKLVYVDGDVIKGSRDGLPEESADSLIKTNGDLTI